MNTITDRYDGDQDFASPRLDLAIMPSFSDAISA
jgi:hypothetical protein